MLELSVSQAQSQLTNILDETVVIVDKKAHTKKAVIIPYSEYEKLIHNREQLLNGAFTQFTGLLDNEFATDDEKYNRIVN